MGRDERDAEMREREHTEKQSEREMRVRERVVGGNFGVSRR